MALPLAKKAIGPLMTGALSGLASLGVNKLFGSKQKGGYLIPDSKSESTDSIQRLVNS